MIEPQEEGNLSDSSRSNKVNGVEVNHHGFVANHVERNQAQEQNNRNGPKRSSFGAGM